MDEIQAEERMLLVLDASVHVHAATFTGAPFDDRVRIYDRQLVLIGRYTDLVAWHDRDLGESRPRRLPALGAPAHMVVGTLAINRYRHLLVRAVADQRAAREVLSRRFHALINRRMYGNRHCLFLLLCNLRSNMVRSWWHSHSNSCTGRKAG